MTFWIITAIVGAFAAGAVSATLLRARAGSETEPGVAAEGAHAQRPAGSEELATPATPGSLPSSLLVDQRSVAGAALGAIVALAMVGTLCVNRAARADDSAVRNGRRGCG